MAAPAVQNTLAGRATSRAPRTGLKAFTGWLTSDTGLKVLSVVFVLVAWEIIGRSSNPVLFTYPSAVWGAAWNMTGEGILIEELLSSLGVLAVGLLAGTAAGIALGLAVGRSRVVAALLDLPTIALYATPMVALVPVLVLWFGFGTTAKIMIVFLFAIFPVLINTARGVQEADPRLEEVTRAFCSSERRRWVDLILPSALPYIVTGIRLAIGRGLIGVVVAEFYTSISGLGYVIVSNANAFRTSRTFVPIVVLMILGIVLTKAVEWVERRLTPWAAR